MNLNYCRLSRAFIKHKRLLVDFVSTGLMIDRPSGSRAGVVFELAR